MYRDRGRLVVVQRWGGSDGFRVSFLRKNPKLIVVIHSSVNILNITELYNLRLCELYLSKDVKKKKLSNFFLALAREKAASPD